MAEMRWVRVQVPESLHGRVRQAKARIDVTWDRIVQAGVELWLASAESKVEEEKPDPE